LGSDAAVALARGAPIAGTLDQEPAIGSKSTASLSSGAGSTLSFDTPPAMRALPLGSSAPTAFVRGEGSDGAGVQALAVGS
jgi:hypothetical protein